MRDVDPTIIAVLFFAIGALLMDMKHDLDGCVPEEEPPAQVSPVRGVTDPLVCAHWQAIGQGWRCV